jgi:hypothetical protein
MPIERLCDKSLAGWQVLSGPGCTALILRAYHLNGRMWRIDGAVSRD